jgi:hypothetical protein
MKFLLVLPNAIARVAILLVLFEARLLRGGHGVSRR